MPSAPGSPQFASSPRASSIDPSSDRSGPVARYDSTSPDFSPGLPMSDSSWHGSPPPGGVPAPAGGPGAAAVDALLESSRRAVAPAPPTLADLGPPARLFPVPPPPVPDLLADRERGGSEAARGEMAWVLPAYALARRLDELLAKWRYRKRLALDLSWDAQALRRRLRNHFTDSGESIAADANTVHIIVEGIRPFITLKLDAVKRVAHLRPAALHARGDDFDLSQLELGLSGVRDILTEADRLLNRLAEGLDFVDPWTYVTERTAPWAEEDRGILWDGTSLTSDDLIDPNVSTDTE